MKLTFWKLIFLLTVLEALCCVGLSRAQDFALTPTHAYELFFCASGETFIGTTFIKSFKDGDKIWFMAPIIVETGNAMWRGPEYFDAKTEAERQYILAKFECDTSGVLLTTLFEILFPERKDNK